MLSDAREHARADFLAFVKGKRIIGPAIFSEYSMRAALALDLPAAG